MDMMKLVLEIRSIPKYATKKALKALGATLNFIDIWLNFSSQ